MRYGLVLAAVFGALATAAVWLLVDDRPRALVEDLARRIGGAGSQTPQGHSSGKLNISVFVFRDRNLNGEYDTADLPMAAVGHQLRRPDGSIRRAPSNVNGYTNFKMSYGNQAEDIHVADKAYSFELMVPPDWFLTTRNPQQTVVFRRLPGSIAGMYAENPPEVVGLAPYRTVKGRFFDSQRPAGARAATVRISALAPNGEALEVTPQHDGTFSFTGSPGEWRIAIRDPATGRSTERCFTVGEAPVALSGIDLGAALPPPLPRDLVEDFEYLERSFIDKIPNGHAGLNWDYLLAVDNQHYNGPGYVNTLVSGRNVAYNSSGHPVTIAARGADAAFDFQGGYFGAAWPRAEGETLLVEAWRGQRRVGREEIRLSHYGPVWFDADYRRIDRLTLATRRYWQFVADDLHFRLPPPAIAEE